MGNEESKNALVVGGATGIGQAIAYTLAKAGYRVAIGGRREEKLKEAQQAYDGPGEILFHTVDVAERDSVAILTDWFNKEIGTADVLANAAGINIRDRSMANMNPDDWDRVIKVNATGAYNMMAAVLPAMRDKESGTIINICLLYTSPSPRDQRGARMPSSA